MNFKDFLIKEQESSPLLEQTLTYLQNKKKILFLTTSNRWPDAEKDDEVPKSTQLAQHLQEQLEEDKVELIHVPELKIYHCTASISSKDGNRCGLKDAVLKGDTKNPTGYHRCWTSLNNDDDQLWKISKPLFESDCVVIFGSVRWGQANSYYQKLIERLSWIENRHTTLGEKNIVKEIDVGLIFIGQNWNGDTVLETQKQVLKFYGFNVVDQICWNWQYTQNALLETPKSYKDAIKSFHNTFGV